MNHLLHIGLIAILVMAMSSCGSSKKAAESRMETRTGLEGETVSVETTKLTGIEMAEALSEDGTKMVKVPYKWYAGIGKANDKQTAIEMAELEARATISRLIENIVAAESERGSIVADGEVQKALLLHWKQMSMSIQNACEPFGETKIEYSPSTKMYSVTTKVGIRGDKYQQMLKNAAGYTPDNLNDKDKKQFDEVNKSIANAAK